MSSSLERRSGGVESWSLRRRLIFEQIVLLALVCVIIVLVSEVALRAFLIDQLDERLVGARDRAGPPPDNGKSHFFERPGLAVGTLNAVINGGRIQVAGR